MNSEALVLKYRLATLEVQRLQLEADRLAAASTVYRFLHDAEKEKDRETTKVRAT